MSGTMGTKLTLPLSLFELILASRRESSVMGRFCARDSEAVGASLRPASRSPGGPMCEVAAICLPLTKLAKGGGPSSSSETTTKPNIRKWSMTVRAKGTHTSSRWREKVSLRLTSRPERRTTQPLLSSWPRRMARAAWMEGLVW